MTYSKEYIDCTSCGNSVQKGSSCEACIEWREENDARLAAKDQRIAELEAYIKNATDCCMENKHDNDSLRTQLAAKDRKIEELEEQATTIRKCRDLEHKARSRLIKTLESLSDAFADCTCDEPEKDHENTTCHAYFDIEACIDEMNQILAGRFK